MQKTLVKHVYNATKEIKVVPGMLTIDKTVFKQSERNKLKQFKKHHNQYGEKLNSQAAKHKFMQMITRLRYAKLNAQITIV